MPGPSLLWDRPGAILDVAVAAADAPRLIEAWERQARRILAAVGWGAEATITRQFHGGASLALSAPIDALYAATEVNEWAFDAALRALAGESPPDDDVATAAATLAATIAAERRPRLIALAAAAASRGVALVVDDRLASIGLGSGSRTWAIDEIPSVDEINWSAVHDVPVALVTGTNGKTTTVRMLGAIVKAAGLVPGFSTTDSVMVGDAAIATGDYSGPEGARLVLRDTRVQVALLETARGGILRRGLTVSRAAAAAITNVADDHLGEFGVHDVAALADVKLVVARAVTKAGRLILNADDPLLVERAGDAPIAWFTLDANRGLVRARVAAGGLAAFVRDGELILARAGGETFVAHVRDVPATFDGAARYNVANALTAILLADALGISVDAMARGLTGFSNSAEQNPGRANMFIIGGATVLVDFAHNPHGLKALLEAAASLPAQRRLVLIGQAGDRDEASIRALARTAWEARPDRIIVKEMARLLRGRAEGEIPALMEDELRVAGAPEQIVSRASTELEAVEAAITWSRPGDLLVLTIHSDRKQVLADLRRRAD